MLGQNNYGKSGIRLVKLVRHPDRHEIRDWTVAVRFEGDFEAAHTAGDNTEVLPTDTMKNTVYALAANHPLDSIESFALHLSQHFLTENVNVVRARIDISERAWERLEVAGRPQRHAFSAAGEERATTRVERDRSGVRIDSGLEDLTILKSSGSGFAGFRRDRYTTLRETADRIFATALKAVWQYVPSDLAFALLRRATRQTLLETFAEHESASVQHTLHAMGEAVLEQHPEVGQIRLSLPNRHHLPVDLSPFGLENKNEIFVATEEPYGLIEATLVRGS
jgi:urate oxidase